MKRLKIIVLSSLLLTQSCERKYSIEIGDNYIINYDSRGNTVVTDKKRTYIIDSQIVAWNFDSTFIIAKQKPFDSIYESIRIKYPNAPSDYQERLYNNTEIFYYWIIDKRKDLYFYNDEKIRIRCTNAIDGPLTYEEYWERRKALNVPVSLQLREAEKVAFDSPFHFLFFRMTNKPREKIVE